MRLSTQTTIIVESDNGRQSIIDYTSQLEYVYNIIASSDREISVQKVALIKIVRHIGSGLNLVKCQDFVEDALRHRPLLLADTLKAELDRQNQYAAFDEQD